MSWVFRFNEVFADMTYLAILYNNGYLAAAGAYELRVSAIVLGQSLLSLCSWSGLTMAEKGD